MTRDQQSAVLSAAGPKSAGHPATDQASLKEQLDFAQRLVSAMPSAVYIKDRHGRYVDCNENYAQWLGRSRSEVIGETTQEVMPAEVATESAAWDAEILASGRCESREMCFMDGEGQQRDVLVNKVRYLDADDQPAGIIGIVTDITEQKQSERYLQEMQGRLKIMNMQLKEHQHQLAQSDKLASIGQLAAGVAHEINNPVGYVMSNLGTLQEYLAAIKAVLAEGRQLAEAVLTGDSEGQQDRAQRLQKIVATEDLGFVLEDIEQLVAESLEGTNRVRDIVSNLKSFARVDEACCKDVDLNEALESTLKVVWNELKYKCKVDKNFGKLPYLRCYPGELNQVFVNLLLNAAQAIDEEGVISIVTEAIDDEIVIQITDDGCGIPAEAMDRIFDPFFTSKELGMGTGLGLSISHGIVKKHHGSIEVMSEVGKGTTFVVRLPREGIQDG